MNTNSEHLDELNSFKSMFYSSSSVNKPSVHPKSIYPNSPTILVLGHTGFVGRYVVNQLRCSNCQVLTPSHTDFDFINPDWRQIIAWLEKVDVVINLVGIMVEKTGLMETVHYQTPMILAQLAKKAGVRKWINLSALGADPNHTSSFLASKGRGDDAIVQLADKNFQTIIVRPSLIFGRGGASCDMFIELAKLPILVLPESGKQRIQPVHIEDVAQGIIKLALNCAFNDNNSLIINFTGADVCTLSDYLSMMRTTIHNKPKPLIVPIANAIAKFAIALIQPFSHGMVTSDSLNLLNRGSIANHYSFSKLLARKPLSYTEFALH